MTMNIGQQVITIAMAVLATMATRFLPFLLFPPDKPTPGYVLYLAKVLPPSVLGMLVVYCLKDVQLLTGSHGVPELIGIAAVVLLHAFKKNMLVSIAGGTVVYMLLVQLVF